MHFELRVRNLVNECLGDYALLDMIEEEFSWQNRLYWWRPLLGPQSVNGIDGGRATCGNYCGDGGAKSQRHHSCQPGPQVIGIDPVQSYSEMTHIKGPWNAQTYDERARHNEPYKSTPSSLSRSAGAPRTKNRTSFPNSPPFQAPSRIRVP